MVYKYLEVCSGCGGLSNGFEKAGLVSHTLIEIDKNCIKTLQKNFKNCNIIHDDMKNIDYSEYKGIIDIVVGGIPCQSFSIAGKREGLSSENKGGLFYDFHRALKEIEPPMFMIENVEGLKNIEKGETLKLMVSKLSKLGYNVVYSVLNSVDYEVPQKRKRLIIIGTKYGTVFEFPEKIDTVLTMHDALHNVPDSKGVEYNEKKKKVMELVPQGGCWIDLPEDVKIEYMGNSLNSGGGKRGIARRLGWDEPSLTLTTSPCQKQTERCHPDETRPLRTREYARIQTFPDTFVFEGSVGSIYKQIGNAVPCQLAYHIGKQIIKCLDELYKREILYKYFLLIIEQNIEKDKNNGIYNKKIMSLLKDLVSDFWKSKIKPIYIDEIQNNDQIKKHFDLIGYDISEYDWEKFEKARIKDKKISNKIGELHEHVMANWKGWNRCKDSKEVSIKKLSVDIFNEKRNIFIELKNNHNTMNATSRKGTIANLTKIKQMYPDAIALIGIVNGRDYIKRINIDNDTKKNTYKSIITNEDNCIWEVSGKELFKLVFDNDTYYDDLIKIVSDIGIEKREVIVNDTKVIMENKKIDDVKNEVIADDTKVIKKNKKYMMQKM